MEEHFPRAALHRRLENSRGSENKRNSTTKRKPNKIYHPAEKEK
jgi:hypothetical protein